MTCVLPLDTRVDLSHLASNEIGLIAKDEFMCYYSLKHAFSALCTLTEGITPPLSDDDVNGIPPGRVEKKPDGTRIAHYLVVQAPIRPLSNMGKVNDLWICTVLGEEAIFYKGKKGWVSWSGPVFSDVILKEQELHFGSLDIYNPFRWYAKGTQNMQSQLPEMIRVRNLMSIVIGIKRTPDYLIGPFVTGMIGKTLELLSHIPESSRKMKRACNGYTVAELKALCKLPSGESTPDSSDSTPTVVPRNESSPIVDENKESDHSPGISSAKSSNSLSLKRPRSKLGVFRVVVPSHSDTRSASGASLGATSLRSARAGFQLVARRNAPPTSISIPSTPRPPISISQNSRILGVAGSVRIASGSIHEGISGDGDPDKEHPNKRPRIEQRPVQTGPMSASNANVAVERDTVSPQFSGLPLIDPIIRIYIETRIFELQISRLVHHSKWFSRKLKENPDWITSTVVPSLTNVSATDFGNLVKAIDKTFDFIQDTPPTSELLSILRAAEALEFTSISSYVIKSLKETWSSSCFKITDKRLQDAAPVVQHAQQFNIPQLHRRAFYEIMRAGMDVITQGLSDKDSVVAYKVQGALQKEWMQFIKTPPQTTCDTQSRTGSGYCSSLSVRKEQWMSNVLESTIYNEGMQDPLYALSRLSKLDWAKQGYCSSCAASWRTNLKEKKSVWWDLLGSFLPVS